MAVTVKMGLAAGNPTPGDTSPQASSVVGRSEPPPSPPMLPTALNLLVTGGTGSFGRKFTEIVLAERKPERLCCYSRDELKQYEMQMAHLNESAMRYFIGDVRDLERLRRAFEGVDVVIHAAALKQVESCEYNPREAVLTNITGTMNVIEAAIDVGVSKVVLVSSDKAVHPVNLYGATKACAEKLIVQGNSYSGETGPRFSVVRYGNVVGSRGSVVPLFLRQRQSGKLTLTDKRMTRFWIKLEEGVRFVLQCLDDMVGGEIFVPKIPTVWITTLAKVMAPDAVIEETGIRPGEKLHEVLVSEDEARHTLEFADHFVICPPHAYWHDPHTYWKEHGGWPMRDGAKYTSDNNPHWLTVEELGEYQ